MRVCVWCHRSLTCGQDLEDDDQISHVVSGGHGALLVGAHLTHLLDLLPGDGGERPAGVRASTPLLLLALLHHIPSYKHLASSHLKTINTEEDWDHFD